MEESFGALSLNTRKRSCIAGEVDIDSLFGQLMRGLTFIIVCLGRFSVVYLRVTEIWDEEVYILGNSDVIWFSLGNSDVIWLWF